MKPIKGVLFDLDGTLLDTAPDLIHALNRLRKEHGHDELSSTELKPLISLGSKSLLKHILDMEDTHPDFSNTRERFFTLYENQIAAHTTFFPHMEKVLHYLDEKNIPWGIVTNKLTKHTTELLKALKLEHRPICVVCGDSLTKYKPDPEPILHACKLLKVEPNECLYIGDAITDVTASKAAGTTSLVALYGYIGNHEDPYSWQADGYLKDASEILKFL